MAVVALIGKPRAVSLLARADLTAPTAATKFRDLDIRDGTSAVVRDLTVSGKWTMGDESAGPITGPSGRTSISGADSATVYMTTETRYSGLGMARPQCRRNVRGGSGQLVGTYLTACDEAGDLTIIGFEPTK